MKRSLNLVYIGTLIVILMLVLFEYAYSAPVHFFNQFQSVTIDAGNIDSSNEKELLIDLSEKNQVNILFNEIEISSKTEYTVYSVEPVILPNFPSMYKTMTNEQFSSLESSSLYQHELFFEINNNTNNLITDLESHGMIVKKNNLDISAYTVSKTTMWIVALTFLLNLSLIIIYFNQSLKKYTIHLLEGKALTNVIFMQLSLNGIKIFLYAGLICLLLFLGLQPELYVFKWYIYIVCTYIVLISVLTILVCKLFDFDSITLYLKEFNNRKIAFNILSGLKIFAFVYLIVTIPIVISSLQHINDLKTQIRSYSKYDNLVVSQTYSPSISNYFDDQSYDQSLTSYYENTVDVFGGVLYYFSDYEAAINYNALKFIDIVDPNGNIIQESELNSNEIIYLVEQSAVDKYSDQYQNIVPIKDGQQFTSVNLLNLSQSKLLNAEVIEYYPREYENYQYSNISSYISKSSYYLNIPGNNKYDRLRPYIRKSNAEGIIVSAPGITVYLQNQLVNTIEEAISKIYIIFLSIITVLIITLFSIETYIKLNIKTIVVKSLEGLTTFSILKSLYLIVLFEMIIIIILSTANKVSFTLSFCWIIIELIITHIISKRKLKKNLTTYLKGNQ